MASLASEIKINNGLQNALNVLNLFLLKNQYTVIYIQIHFINALRRIGLTMS